MEIITEIANRLPCVRQGSENQYRYKRLGKK